MEELSKYSNMTEAQKKAYKYLGKNGKLYISNRKDKKYYVFDDNNNKIHFGQMGYEDFTKHKDEQRRQNYLKRASNIKGEWRQNKFSPNNLSINILW